MICKNCCSQIPNDSSFCPNCGTKVADNASSDNRDNTANIKENLMPNVSTNNTSAKKRRIIVPIIIVVFCILIGVALWVVPTGMRHETNIPIINKALVNCIPECHDLKWGMSYDDVLSLTTWVNVGDDGGNAVLYTQDIGFYEYKSYVNFIGFDSALCYFDNSNRLVKVVLVKEAPNLVAWTLDDVGSFYEGIYGETIKDYLFDDETLGIYDCKWEGMFTDVQIQSTGLSLNETDDSYVYVVYSKKGFNN